VLLIFCNLVAAIRFVLNEMLGYSKILFYGLRTVSFGAVTLHRLASTTTTGTEQFGGVSGCWLGGCDSLSSYFGEAPCGLGFPAVYRLQNIIGTWGRDLPKGRGICIFVQDCTFANNPAWQFVLLNGYEKERNFSVE